MEKLVWISWVSPMKSLGLQKLEDKNQMQIRKIIARKRLDLVVLTLNLEERPRTKRSVEPLRVTDNKEINIQKGTQP